MALKKAKKKVSKKPAPKKAPSKKTKSAKAGEFKYVKPEVVHSSKKKINEPEVDEIDLIRDPPEIPESADSRAIAPADPMARYLAEIRKYPLLTREQEQALAIRYRETGDQKAAEQLVTANLRFVVKVAAEYTKFGARLIDLVQEGNVGLMHAVKEFNPYKGVRIITYAVWWIRGYIQEYLMRQYSMVRIGTTSTQKKLFYQLQRERENLEKMGMQAGIAQLSGRLGIPEEDIQDMQQRLTSRDVSLDQPVGEDGSSSMLDFQGSSADIAVDEQIGQQEALHQLTDNIEAIRPELSERELYLLDARLLSDEPLTLQEIGDKYGITREAVRQMEARLLEKLRKQMS